MNNSIYRSGNLQSIITVDPFLLADSEVIFGPGSIVYGSDAMGGVIDFHSKRIEPKANSEFSVNGKAIARYSSANNEKTGHFDFTLTKDNWGSFTSLSSTNFGDQIMGNMGPSEYARNFYVERINGIDQMILNENSNKQVSSGYNQLNFMQKFKYQANADLSLEYLFYYTQSSDIPRYDRLIQMGDDNLKYAEWYYGPQNWMVNSLIIHSEKATKLWEAYKLQISAQQYEESRYDRKFSNDILNSRVENLNIFSINADFNKKFTPDFFYFFGLEASYDKLKSTAYSQDITTGFQNPLSTRYPDGDNNYFSAAAYSAFRYKMNRKIDISGGFRYSYVNTHSTFIDKTFFPFDYDAIDLANDALTVSLGFVYRNDKHTRVNLNLSTGFRAPNIDDLAKVFDSEPGTVVVPNPNLKPEYVYSADLGLNQAFLDQKLRIELVAFYSYLDNAMVRRDFTMDGLTTMIYDGEESDIQAIVNAGYAEIYGLTAQVDFKLNEYLTWKNGISRIKGYDNDGFSIRHAPPLYGNSSINFENDTWKLQLNTFFNNEISFEDLSPTEADKPYLYAVDENGNPYSPTWFTVDLKSSYKFSDTFSLLFELENLMDKRYRTYSSGIAAPGRSFRLSLNYKF
jgi:hemoglobin/transferrin/lactoferrin receptor protein